VRTRVRVHLAEARELSFLHHAIVIRVELFQHVLAIVAFQWHTEHCTQNRDCRYISFSPVSGTCLLYATCRAVQANDTETFQKDGFVQVSCLEPCSDYSGYNNLMAQNPDVTIEMSEQDKATYAEAPSMSHCEHLCSTHDLCEFFTFFESTRDCKLFTECTETGRMAGGPGEFLVFRDKPRLFRRLTGHSIAEDHLKFDTSHGPFIHDSHMHLEEELLEEPVCGQDYVEKYIVHGR
jgi:hypothetical protein